MTASIIFLHNRNRMTKRKKERKKVKKKVHKNRIILSENLNRQPTIRRICQKIKKFNKIIQNNEKDRKKCLKYERIFIIFEY